MTRLVIEIPDEVDLPAGIGRDQQLLREAIAIALYKRDRVSLREARGIVGMDRRQFEEMLGSYGVAMQDEEDLDSILDDIGAARHRPA